MAPAERDKMKAELLAARDRQASATAAKDAAAKDTTKIFSKCPSTVLAQPDVRAKRTPIQLQIRTRTSNFAPEFALNP